VFHCSQICKRRFAAPHSFSPTEIQVGARLPVCPSGKKRHAVALRLCHCLILREIDDLAAIGFLTSHNAIIVAAQAVSAVMLSPVNTFARCGGPLGHIPRCGA
jgi:hypothetical protein